MEDVEVKKKRKKSLIGYGIFNWQDHFTWHFYNDRDKIFEYKLKPFLFAEIAIEKYKIKNYATKRLKITIEEL